MHVFFLVCSDFRQPNVVGAETEQRVDLVPSAWLTVRWWLYDRGHEKLEFLLRRLSN